MFDHLLEREQWLPRAPEEVFPFFADALNLEAITPSWLRFRVVTPAPIEMRAGALIDYRLRLRGVSVAWHTRIEAWEPPRRFVDRQLRGPYRHWVHTHSFRPEAGGTVMRDAVAYGLPLGPLGELAHAAFVRRDLERIFAFRHAEVARRLAAGDTAAVRP
ncbi:MAG: SRPBCC family protein [Actinomycetota bacterium]|nr:SRPBCC family protein [Actinomycetota bacterium]